MFGRDGHPSPLGQAFIEYRRIAKTLHLLALIDPIDGTYQRRMNRQLTVQESRHRLARKICHGNRGQIRQAYREGQEDQLAAGPANHDGRRADRLRTIQSAAKLIVRAIVGTLVVAPHLAHYLECLLQPFESLLHRRERDAESDRLLLIPSSAEPQERAPTRRHVEGRDDLCEQTRPAGRRPGDWQ